MKCSLVVLLATVFCCNGLEFKTLDKEVGPVIFVNALFRHGERTIISPYPNDPNRDPKKWPLGWGQLTKEGIRHHYFLGNWIGQRYKHLLPENRNYNAKAIRVLSTDVDRTLMSAEANLAGMFPLTDEEKWGGIKYQPVPIHTIPEILDKLLAMKYPCKRFEYELHKFKNSEEYRGMMKKFKPMGDYISEMSGGATFNSIEYYEYMYSTLEIERLYNLTLPDWTKTVFPDQLKVPAGLSFAISTWTPEMKRLQGGPLVKDMLGNMQKKLVGGLSPPTLNMSVYSAHDTTVSAFLNTLNMYNYLPPPFASLVLVELRQTATNDHVVTVLFKNSTDPAGDPHLLTIPGCTEACPLNVVANLWKPVMPTDWDAECHQHQFFDLTSDQPYNTLAIFAMVTSSLVVFLVLALASVYCTKPNHDHIYHKLSVETL